MRVEKIPAHEQDFDRSGIDSDGKRHMLIRKSIEIFAEDAFMHYVEARPENADESYFYRTRYEKKQIVLHYTIGYLKGDIATLSKHRYHVSVPFVIGRNGSIYNLFPSYYWSYHLGRGAIGGNAAQSKKTIAIELSNIGPLLREGNDLVTIYGDVYCTLDQERYYWRQSFRGYDYFATFTEAQYQALIVLLRYLTARYEIPRETFAGRQPLCCQSGCAVICRDCQPCQLSDDRKNGYRTGVRLAADSRWPPGTALNSVFRGCPVENDPGENRGSFQVTIGRITVAQAVFPGDGDLVARLTALDQESEIGVPGNPRSHFCHYDDSVVVPDDEFLDVMGGDQFAALFVAIAAGFHGMGDQRSDLGFAVSAFGAYLDTGHCDQPPQPPSVTLTFFRVWK